MLNCVTSFWMVRWGRKAAPNTCVDIILFCPPHSKLLLTPHPEEWILLLFALTRGAAQARTLAVVFKMLTFSHLLPPFTSPLLLPHSHCRLGPWHLLLWPLRQLSWPQSLSPSAFCSRSCQNYPSRKILGSLSCPLGSLSCPCDLSSPCESKLLRLFGN